MFRRLAALAAILTLAVLAMVPVSTATAGGANDRPLTIERDFRGEPASSLVPAGYTTVLAFPLASFILSAGNEDVAINTLYFRVVGSEHIATLHIFHAGNLIKSFPVGGSSPQVITVGFGDGALSVPAGTFKSIAILGETYPMFDEVEKPIEVSLNEAPIEVSLIGAMGTTPSQRVWDFHAVPGPTHRYFGSYPKFTVNASSPAGTLIPSSNTLLAIFDVSVVGTKCVTFSGGDKIVLNISQSINDSNGTLNAFELRDYDTGISLDTTAAGGAGSEVQSATVTFDFTDATLTIPAGTTKRIAVYGNTQELEDTGDSIQVWLDDSRPDNLAWGIDGIGPYHRADIILRGDVYAGALQKR